MMRRQPVVLFNHKGTKGAKELKTIDPYRSVCLVPLWFFQTFGEYSDYRGAPV